MKKILLSLSVATMLLTSCTKQLDEYNPSGLTAEAVFTTPDGFEALVNAAYSYQRWWYGKEEGMNMSEMGTDLWMSAAGDVWPDLSQYVNLQGTNAAIRDEWTALYGAINLCNAGINKINQAGLAPARKVQREAELKFLRAFYYWHIVETWGGVHFSLDETTGIMTTANKTPVEDFYKQIISDLSFSVDNLAPTTSDYGRVTKPAAMSFLARVYLGRNMNAEASALARQVINGGYGYTLLPNYKDLWSMSNNQNKEIVYAVNYAANLTLNDIRTSQFTIGHSRGSNSAHMMFLMKYDDQPRVFRITEYGRPFNRYMPTRFLLDLYTEADGRYDASFQESWNSCTTSGGVSNPGDTALIATRKVNNGPRVIYDAAGKVLKTIYDRNTTYYADGKVNDRLRYPSLTKHTDPTRATFNEAQSAKDFFVIRFAELYLIAAEAQHKLGRNDSAAYYMNFVRERAAKPGQAANMRVSASDITLDFILDERAREFAGEQMRWFDLKRTNTLKSRIQRYNPDVAPNIQDFHTVRPIPQSQLDEITNKSEFTQNPGYQ